MSDFAIMSTNALAQEQRRRGSATDRNMKCPGCDVMVVLKKDQTLQCKLCDSVWHKDCIADMDEDTYRVMKKNEKKETLNLYWFCTKQCDRAAGKFLSGMAHLEAEIKSTNLKVSALEKTVLEIGEGHFTEKMTRAVQEIASEVVSKEETENTKVGETAEHFSKVQKIIEHEKKDQIAEIEDRMRRKCNIVLFRLQEKENLSVGEAKEEDKKQVDKILRELGSKAIPEDIRRLGKYNQQNPRPRPVRVSFSNEKEKDEVLTLAYKASKNKTEEDQRLCCQVTLRKDLSVQEREEEEKLYAELKKNRQESKESGDDRARWVRRRGKVINIGNYKRMDKEDETSQRDKDPPEVWA